MALRSMASVHLGHAVRAARLRRGLSQEEVGLRGNVDRTYVGAVERGERNVTVLSLRKIAAALDVPASELVAAAERLEREHDTDAAPA